MEEIKLKIKNPEEFHMKGEVKRKAT